MNEAEKTLVEKRYRPTPYISGETGALQQIDALMRAELRLVDTIQISNFFLSDLKKIVDLDL